MGSGFASGVGAGYLSAPRYSYGFGNPFYSPSPYGYYGGGPGVITYSRGPNLFPLLFFGGLAFAASRAIGSASDTFSSVTTKSSSVFDTPKTSALGSGSSVVKVSVAMKVPNRDDPNSILSVLDRLSRTSRTNSRMGVQNLTSQVALEILRRKSSIRSAFAESQQYRDESRAQREYNSQAFRERAKFESETVSNYGGVDYSSSSSLSYSLGGPTTGSKATIAVVTMLLNIDGDKTKMNKINSMSDVENALRLIATDAKVDDCLQGVEILWTPEDRSETLTSRDIIVDYPELRSV